MLESFPWHAKLWRNIERSRAMGRFPHAFLLWGQKGIGKTHFAAKLANDLLCLTSEHACGECQGCQWAQKNIHPDFIKLEPIKGKKKITVDQIRELQSHLSLSNLQKTPRVILIADAGSMNIAACNALLKSLEEPSTQCIYILVSNSLLTIPATIQSRCQTLYFAPASLSEVEKYLVSQGQEIKQASLLHGSPLLADKTLSTNVLAERHSIVDNLWLLLSGESSPCQVVAGWGKLDELFVLRVLFEWFSDLVKFSCQISTSGLTHQTSLSQLQKMLAILGKKQLFIILDKILLMTEYVIMARQINVSLWFDDLAIEILNHKLEVE